MFQAELKQATLNDMAIFRLPILLLKNWLKMHKLNNWAIDNIHNTYDISRAEMLTTCAGRCEQIGAKKQFKSIHIGSPEFEY